MSTRVPLHFKESFCDLDLNSMGVDCCFIPDLSEYPQMGGPLCRVKQVHGKDILHVQAELIASLSGPGYVQFQYDGMMTSEPGAFLSVYSADCLPLLFFEPERRIVASIHSGWRGTLLNICGRAIERMVQIFKCDPSKIRVVSGPSIHVCCFEIREDVATLFRNADPAAEEMISRSDGKMKLDLPGLNCRQLLNTGVLRNHVELNETCTYCNLGLLPSFRREGRSDRRIVGAIRLRDGDKR